jgi:alcohol dehydrogenase YqhD (iron-dependent ADH family)
MRFKKKIMRFTEGDSMNSFMFQNTTAIYFGEGQIAKIAESIPQNSKILLLYGGGSIKHNGVYEQAKEALVDHDWDEFGGIEPNPQYDTLMQAVEKIKKENFNFVLAVGGGSVIDGAKFVVAAAKYDGNDAWDILKKGIPVTDAMPLGCVLTLPATGSETNIGAVISKGNDKLVFTSPLVRPLFAVLDPKTTLSLSSRQISNGVIDAFIHVMEQYITYPVNAKVQDRFAEGLLLTLMEEGPKALENPKDMDARANIMFAATLALNGLIGSGVPQDWTTHMIGHELTGNFGIDHARTLSIILPAVLKKQRKQKEEKLLQYSERVLGITSASNDELIDQAIDRTVAFFKSMQAPTSLRDVDLKEKDIDTIIKSLEKHSRLKLGEHSDIDLSRSREILLLAL